MKYYSEKLDKMFESEKELLDAEAQLQAKELKAQQTEKTKKELAKAIENADEKINEANKLYEIAQQKAADILEKSNKEAKKVLDDAKEKVKQAEDEKLKALIEFNKRFGTYSKTITGEKAAEEYKKAVDRFNNSFESVFKDFLRFWR